ncbi:MAG: glycerol-3-phosphate acyltransferase PlsY [Chloroflexi bacterium]|jgi:glycerol-3-phosphate acyltransferase PlsY|nr:MAG: glycerol-3-phosphate acyltransferase PlsY [Chloroflexota bacterium]
MEECLTLILACLVSYIFGALPFAHRISRRKGIDIFSIGTGLAGASNVMKNVGRLPAIIVLFFDIAKGALAVIVSDMMGVEGPLILLPASAAIFGHWNSIFTRFKGGDGMAIAGGIAIALFGGIGFFALFVACIVTILTQKLWLTSLTSIIFAYLSLLFLTHLFNKDEDIAVGFTAVVLLILTHAMRGHARRRKIARQSE